jgi:hypothetical protein
MDDVGIDNRVLTYKCNSSATIAFACYPLCPINIKQIIMKTKRRSVKKKVERKKEKRGKRY